MKNFLLIAFLVFEVAAWADCTTYLASPLQNDNLEQELSAVEQFKVYLEMLFQNNLVSFEDFKKMQEAYQSTGQLENLLRYDKVPNSEKGIHAENLQVYLDVFSEADRNDVFAWLSQFIIRIEGIVKSKEDIQQQTVIPYRPIKFIKVLANGIAVDEKSLRYKKFLNYLQTKFKKSELISNHDFEIMDTPVTQAQWANMMGSNPSQLNKENYSPEPLVTTTINGNSVEMYYDVPVNHVSLWDAMLFANKMSELHKLEPVYDVSQMQLERATKATGAGQFFPKKPELLKINAPGGDIYKAEGYRLPTPTEMQVIFGDPVPLEGLSNLKTDEQYLSLVGTNSSTKRALSYLYAVDDEFFIRTAGGLFYYTHGDLEWTSRSSNTTFEVDDNAFVKLEMAGNYVYYHFGKGLGSGTNPGGFFEHFRLVRSLFKNKEGSKP